MFGHLFNPKSIVVVGASNNPFKPGGRVIKNIKDHGYRGSLWAVNPGSASVMGLPTFKSIEELPGCPELALIAIPASGVGSALEGLARKGTNAAIILSSGFGEVDEKGKKEEERLLEIANRANMALIGPNCSGFLTPTYMGKFPGIIPKMREGTVDFISGSGATVDYLLEQASYRGLSFSNVVNLGNSIQIGVEDILEMFDENYGPESARIIMLYMELVKKPGKLLRHARSLTKKRCTIIGVKAGVTEAGERAAASHTGAMATNDTAVQALFEKAGIIRVKSKMELIDLACVLMAAQGPIAGNRACIITDAGGPGVMLSDELDRQGLEVPLLSERSRSRLAEILPPESSVENPIDCLSTRKPSQIKEIFRILREEEKGNIDVIAILMGNSGMSENRDIYEEIDRAMDESPIPVIPLLSSATTCAELLEKFKDAGKFYFQDEVTLGYALGKVVQRPILFEPQKELQDYKRTEIEAILRSQKNTLAPGIVKDILAAAGFNVPIQIEVYCKEELICACEKVGFPLVMKVIGPLHKSDVGGVRIGTNSPQEANTAWEELLAVKGACGVLVQKMVQGTEVIIGATKQGEFGHLVMFGLGGIFTEVLRDVRFSLAPMAKEECLKMIMGIKGYPILKGVRGMKGVSVELLSEYIERLSLLVNDFPQIKEIDLNPIKGLDSDLYPVDARIILE